jgi:hypothetical protein
LAWRGYHYFIVNDKLIIVEPEASHRGCHCGLVRLQNHPGRPHGPS